MQDVEGNGAPPPGPPVIVKKLSIDVDLIRNVVEAEADSPPTPSQSNKKKGVGGTPSPRTKLSGKGTPKSKAAPKPGEAVKKEKSVVSKAKSGPKSPKSPAPHMVGPDGSNVGRWSDLEHAQFLEGLKRYGKRWKQISDHIKTRSVVQIRSHAQKFFKRQAKDDLPVEIASDGESDEEGKAGTKEKEKVTERKESKRNAAKAGSVGGRGQRERVLPSHLAS
mmetsp:Transcript_18570/g.37942  ORF Transcript_18570/g.37942 Transcript_18570/m.37942 type:complete len:221 (+) Transcript_18570:685-1347(+)